MVVPDGALCWGGGAGEARAEAGRGGHPLWGSCYVPRCCGDRAARDVGLGIAETTWHRGEKSGERGWTLGMLDTRGQAEDEKSLKEGGKDQTGGVQRHPQRGQWLELCQVRNRNRPLGHGALWGSVGLRGAPWGRLQPSENTVSSGGGGAGPSFQPPPAPPAGPSGKEAC